VREGSCVCSTCLRITCPSEALLEIAQDNAALHTLRLYADVHHLLQVPQVDALLAAAPRLVTLQCGVTGEPQELLLPLLRKEPPTYGCLRLTRAAIGQSRDG
jgi:hypothetical protein